MTELPTACTLEPEQMPGRLAFIEGLTADALIDQQPIAGGQRSRFRDTPDVEQRVRDLVAAESECCAFLRFELARDEHALLLDITGSPDAQPVIRRFFAPAC